MTSLLELTVVETSDFTLGGEKEGEDHFLVGRLQACNLLL